MEDKKDDSCVSFDDIVFRAYKLNRKAMSIQTAIQHEVECYFDDENALLDIADSMDDFVSEFEKLYNDIQNYGLNCGIGHKKTGR